MEKVIAAGLFAMVLSIIVGPKFIEFLRRNELGQHIREEGPEWHRTKQGTPTMGGVLIVLASALPFLILSEYTLSALTVFLAWAAREQGLDTDVYIPALGQVELSWVWYVLVFFIVAGAANGVNLTDGLDGLAAGTGIIALLTCAALPVIAFIRQRGETDLDLAILGAALIGGTIGFLWYNAFPAEVFMGDTGSMAIGGALAGFAVMTKTETLLPLIGGIFLIEALSVMIQVFTFKYLGRRVFLMAPIHYHFEMKAWSETKIMVRFWIVAAILSACGFVLYYRYYLQFRL